MATLPADFPYLSPSEFRIFSLLSKRKPLTIREIGIELLRLDPDFHQGYNTLGTILQRLLRKGYVEQRANGTAPHLYRPSYPFDLALRRHVERFLEDFTISAPIDLRAVLEMVVDRLAPATSQDFKPSSPHERPSRTNSAVEPNRQ